jgi:hypothetical protein
VIDKEYCGRHFLNLQNGDKFVHSSKTPMISIVQNQGEIIFAGTPTAVAAFGISVRTTVQWQIGGQFQRKRQLLFQKIFHKSLREKYE